MKKISLGDLLKRIRHSNANYELHRKIAEQQIKNGAKLTDHQIKL